MAKKHSGKGAHRRRGRSGRVVLTAFCVALVIIMAGLAAYIAYWYLNLGRIRAEGKRYASLYGDGDTGPTAAAMTAADSPAQSAAPEPTRIVTPEPTEAVTPEPTEAVTSEPTEAVTPEPIRTDTPVPTEAVTPEPTKAVTPGPIGTDTPVPTEAVTPEPIEAVTPEPTQVVTPTPSPTPAPRPGQDMPVVEDVPIPTPDSDTLVIALPTAPPVQSSFDGLLALNPETVAFLDIEGMLSLPVVQRENDNEYYLGHSFEDAPAQEGTLFLDGMNRLTPEDDCLIVYGHNMKNRTMFGRLSAYADVKHLRSHPLIRFDTLYENRRYAVFAAFSASMTPGNSRYFDVRKFIFDETEFDKFVLKLQSRSLYSVPLDVRYGDRLLLLVTCDYSNREGRFILALRQLRDDENEGDIWSLTRQAKLK